MEGEGAGEQGVGGQRRLSSALGNLPGRGAMGHLDARLNVAQMQDSPVPEVGIVTWIFCSLLMQLCFTRLSEGVRGSRAMKRLWSEEKTRIPWCSERVSTS